MCLTPGLRKGLHPVIIFDTNALNNIQLESPRADIMRKFRASAQHRVAVPWMVLEELVAHQATNYMDTRNAARTALKTLRKAAPWQADDGFVTPDLELEQCQDYWREQYGELFDEIVETSGEAARKALGREALALPPARRGEKKSVGSRDAAIWFSVLDFLRANPGEDVWFVTDDGDFGDGTTYEYPMDEDLGDMAGRLHRITDFDGVVTRFTEPIEPEQARTETEALLRSALVRETIAGAACDLLRSPLGFAGTGTGARAARWQSFLSRPRAGLLRFKKVQGHRIGADVWYTAETTWLLYGTALDAEQDGVDTVTCTWEVKLLFSTAGAQEAPTVLRTGSPAAPDPADESVGAVLAALRDAVLRETAENARAKDRTRLTVGEIAALTEKPPLDDYLASLATAYNIGFRETDVAKTLLHSTSIDIAGPLPDWTRRTLLGASAVEEILRTFGGHRIPLFEFDADGATGMTDGPGVRERRRQPGAA